ncbi:MAG: galactose-1-phosphate uridylyltransferase [candidate division KSB1 bacterium]|nr:galactose-1-phosphate uridylyltransferase [candidate division KSB1 bacterium]MDZ7302662.1 galactose-1-phosphate uridylyltransferase [candidate division KSB1 bacterium]MDZ7311808.1 galactose-1-phosphate uridylyltransferase [candidate division KSB1 bacterium]
MPELRYDPVQKRWVIIATERSLRPSDFNNPCSHPQTAFCPFCPGNEDKTPPEIFALREPGTQPNQPGWRVRVVPNKYPALRIEGELDRRGHGVYDTINGIGAHEVIIETPDHNTQLANLPLSQFVEVLKAYRARLIDLMKDGRFRYILIFRNYGADAGTSLLHPHTQIIATPITPRTVAMELESAREHYAGKERCLYCDIIQQELEEKTRIISEDDFIVWAPYASRFPYEITIAPRKHQHDYATLPDDELAALARTMKSLLQRLQVTLNDPPYNFLFHTSPNTETVPRRPTHWLTLPYDFHWHIEVIPRLTRIAGFEWGSGFYINPQPPETAAGHLREAEIGAME